MIGERNEWEGWGNKKFPSPYPVQALTQTRWLGKRSRNPKGDSRSLIRRLHCRLKRRITQTHKMLDALYVSDKKVIRLAR